MKNGFLLSKAELDEARAWLVDHGYQTHHDPRKDWDLRHVVEHLVGDKDILDMGAFGSMVLPTASSGGSYGRKVGIDLQVCPHVMDVDYHVGDLTDPPFANESFDVVTCLSVIEHKVNLIKFVESARRMLRPGGTLLVSFDFWPVPIDTSIDPNWVMLNVHAVVCLLEWLDAAGFKLPGKFQWSILDAPIEHLGLHYTFGMISATKSANR